MPSCPTPILPVLLHGQFSVVIELLLLLPVLCDHTHTLHESFGKTKQHCMPHFIHTRDAAEMEVSAHSHPRASLCLI